MSRIVEFFRKPIPREVLKSVHDIPYDKFKVLGFDTFIFDYDNTLAPFKKKVSSDVVEMFKTLTQNGFKVAVVTNGPFKRAENLKKRVEGLRVFARARKPGLRMLKLALKKLDSSASRTVLVGDLFFTDIIAGNRLGMYTILVAPYPGVGFFLKTIAVLEKISYKVVFYTFGWLFRIADLVSPNEWKKDVFDVNYEKFISHGVKMFVFDMDGTLAKWKAERLEERTVSLLERLNSKSEVVILSNGNSPSLKWARNSMQLRVISRAHKPLTTKLLKLMKERSLSKAEVVMIGDQLFTDVLMANLAGVYSIKVEPLSKEEIMFTKVLRFFEKMVKPLIRSKPKMRAINGNRGEKN